MRTRENVRPGSLACEYSEHPWVDPIRVFRAARGLPGRVMLDSGGDVAAPSRCSVLTFRPLQTLEARVGAGLLAGPIASADDPFSALESLFSRWQRKATARPLRASAVTANAVDRAPSRALGSSVPFTGGVIAALGYDAGRTLERLPSVAQDDPLLPDFWAGLYDGAIVFDRAARRVLITSWGLSGAGRLSEMEGVLRAARGEDGDPPDGCAGAEPSRIAGGGSSQDGAGGYAPEDAAERERFLQGVSSIKAEIGRGEIYQANLTRRVVRAVPAEQGSRIYERLRSRSPVPYGAYVDAGSFQILSASPERFLAISAGNAETRPIKGTRPRGGTAAEDARLRRELLASPKDRAELLMIVDLERNDLGRVSETGSVRVGAFPRVEGYSTVWHMVATVRGRMAAGVSPVAAVRALFPGGSITGAPKIRAMEILEALEPRRRKFSMGSLIAWDLGGRFDSSILIRTMVLRGGEALFDVGGGIVAESSPEEEYRETVAKAAPLLASLEGF